MNFSKPANLTAKALFPVLAAGLLGTAAQATPLTDARNLYGRTVSLSFFKGFDADALELPNISQPYAKILRETLRAERNTFSRIEGFNLSHYANMGRDFPNGRPFRAEDDFTAYNHFSGRGHGWGHIKHNGEDYGHGNGGNDVVTGGGTPDVSPVPEPATITLFAMGVAGLAAVARRKKKDAQPTHG